jgi:hypothetical protein
MHSTKRRSGRPYPITFFLIIVLTILIALWVAMILSYMCPTCQPEGAWVDRWSCEQWETLIYMNMSEVPVEENPFNDNVFYRCGDEMVCGWYNISTSSGIAEVFLDRVCIRESSVREWVPYE